MESDIFSQIVKLESVKNDVDSVADALSTMLADEMADFVWSGISMEDE